MAVDADLVSKWLGHRSGVLAGTDWLVRVEPPKLSPPSAAHRAGTLPRISGSNLLTREDRQPGPPPFRIIQPKDVISKQGDRK